MSGTVGSGAKGEARKAPALTPLSPSRPKDSVVMDPGEGGGGVEEASEEEAPETEASIIEKKNKAQKRARSGCKAVYYRGGKLLFTRNVRCGCGTCISFAFIVPPIVGGAQNAVVSLHGTVYGLRVGAPLLREGVRTAKI